MAGHPIVLAVDSDPFVLGCHVRNNADCQHICCALPRDDLPLPSEGEWHLHGSPPCTRLSIMQPVRHQADRRKALDLVEWFFELVNVHRPTSWTMEQVNHEAVREQLSRLKSKHPLLFDWTVVDCVDYEVPQHRRRIIAGSPFLIANLRAFRSSKPALCVRDVIQEPPGEYIRNNLYSRPHQQTRERVEVPLKDQIRSVDDPSYTILATGHKRWSDSEGNVLRNLRGSEAALIQSFPVNYKLPWSPTVSLMGVGNALPPRLAKILMTPTWKGQ